MVKNDYVVRKNKEWRASSSSERCGVVLQHRVVVRFWVPSTRLAWYVTTGKRSVKGSLDSAPIEVASEVDR